MDKINGKFVEFCNECGWEEKTIGLPYQFCPKCGHINIGFVTRKGVIEEKSNAFNGGTKENSCDKTMV